MSSCRYSKRIGRAARPEQDHDLLGHLQSCDRCRTEREIALRVADLGKLIPWHPLEPEAAAAARARVTWAGLAGARQDVALGRRPPVWVRFGLPFALTLGAASVLAAVGAGLLHPRGLVRRPPIGPPLGSTSPAPARPMPSAPALPAAPPGASLPAPAGQPSPASPTRTAAGTAPAPAVADRRALPRRASLARLSTPAGADSGRGGRATLAPSLPSRVPALAPTAPIATPPPPVLGIGPGEQAFMEGWRAIRDGDHLSAARAMTRAIEASPHAMLAEDARYWRAIALGRSGRVQAARAAMEEFLRLHPQSTRAGEVSAILGWLLLDARESAAAELRFRAAELDLRPAVRDSARAGLQALGVY
jgi:TolA-binding protein